MTRATTPIHTFTLPFEVNNIKKLLVSYAQNNKIIFEKNEKDVSMNDITISIGLTQEETLRFDPTMSVQIQMRILTHTDTAMASQIFTIPCGRVINQEVMS